MRKRVFEFLVIYFIATIIMYAIVAFIEWDINAGHWEEHARAAVGLIPIFIAAIKEV